MKFETYDNFDPIIGSSFKGKIQATFFQLVNTFGKPISNNNDTEADWVIRFDDEDGWTPVSIYNWNSKGRIEDIDTWNVGGFDNKALEKVKEALKG